MDAKQKRNYLTRHQLKQKAGITDSEVLKLQMSGELVPARRGINGVRFYLTSEVTTWLEHKALAASEVK